MKKILAVCTLCIFLLSGCGMLPKLMGGDTSKGHGNDNEILVGSDSIKGINTGDRIDRSADLWVDDVNGTIATGDTRKANMPISGKEFSGNIVSGEGKSESVTSNVGDVVGDVSIFLGSIKWWHVLIIAVVAGLLIPSPLSLLRRRQHNGKDNG